MIGLSSPLSHIKWCNIQLPLYSQQTAPNYTSGFNNIHLQCAQQNCMDTPLILHCPMILGPIQQLTDSGYQDRQHHLITDRFLKIISDPVCTATARTCQQDCHYCFLLWLWVATIVIIIRAHFKVTFMSNTSVSVCALYNSQPATLCSQTVCDCMCLQLLQY